MQNYIHFLKPPNFFPKFGKDMSIFWENSIINDCCSRLGCVVITIRFQLKYNRLMCFDWNCIGDGTDVERRKSGRRAEEERKTNGGRAELERN